MKKHYPSNLADNQYETVLALLGKTFNKVNAKTPPGV